MIHPTLVGQTIALRHNRTGFTYRAVILEQKLSFGNFRLRISEKLFFQPTEQELATVASAGSRPRKP